MNGLLWLLVPVLLGLVALAYFAVRSRLQVRPTAAAAPAPPVPEPEDIRRALADLLGSMVGTVAPDILARYESIHRRMLAMIPRLGQLEGTSQDLYIMHRTASDYLPTAVQSYLSLVRTGTNEQRLPDGRTPHQALLEQLDLIETKLADIGEALDRNDLDRLLIHGRFLQARFDRPPSGLGLELPTPEAGEPNS
jgi:hypothetical protein